MAHVFMTGVTGQVGSFAARELLARGHRLSLLVRGEEPARRVERIFRKLGAAGDFRVVPGDLTGPAPEIGAVDAFLHLAAELSFSPAQRDLVREVNCRGTANMLEWARVFGAPSFHYVSTAYVAGLSKMPFDEECLDLDQNFRNDYEASKLDAERMCREFCLTWGIPLKIYRPGIVMGADSGESLRYQGFYVFLKVLGRLRDSYRRKAGRSGGASVDLGARIEANPEGSKNLVPVDYVARAIAELATQADRPIETVFLLPEKAPTNQQTLDWTQEALGISGLTLVPFGAMPQESRTPLEKLIASQIQVYRTYLEGEPDFRHARSLQRLGSLGIPPARVDAAYMRRLAEYGERDLWGRDRPKSEDGKAEHPYFGAFLPRFVGGEFLPGISTLTSRFAVRLPGDGQSWELHLEKGILCSVGRSEGQKDVDFVYEVPEDVFGSIVAGRTDPRSAFFAGKTDIRGDIEKGLKVANALRRFFSLHPYDGKQPF